MNNQARVAAGSPQGGQFATSTRAEADGVSLTPTPSVAPVSPETQDAYVANLREGDVIWIGGAERLVTSIGPAEDSDLLMVGFDYAEADEDMTPFGKRAVVGRVSQAPLSAHEFGTAARIDTALRQMEASGLDDTAASAVTMPDGSTVEIIPDPDTLDENGQVPGGITESGTYAITRLDGSTSVRGFDDLGERGQVAQAIAFEATFAARDQVVTDRRPEPPTLPDDAVRDGSGTALGPDGSLYVDNPGSFWHGTEVLSTYTRAQAIADGVLRDHSEEARRNGIAWPVTMTAAAHADTVTWNDSNAGLQDETGRAADVMLMASLAIRARARQSDTIQAGDRIPFEMVRVPNTPRAQHPRKVALHAVLAPDEDGRPCWVISQPHEN